MTRGVTARDEAEKGPGARSCRAYTFCWKKQFIKRNLGYENVPKGRYKGVGEVMDTGLEGRGVSWVRKPQRLHQPCASFPSLSPGPHGQDAGTCFCTWHVLQGLGSLAKAHLSTLMDLEVPHFALQPPGRHSNKSPCLILLIELQREKALVHSANLNPSPYYLTMFNVLKSPLRHASKVALN